MTSSDELRRLRVRPLPDEKSSTGVIQVVVATSIDALDFLERCTEALVAIDTAPEEAWPSFNEWTIRLPSWLVEKFAPEPTVDEQNERLANWRKLSPEARGAVAAEQQWSLANWIAWFVPEEREWFWWDGTADGTGRATIRVETFGYPAPLGSLDWLLRSAGATRIDFA
jgi:hypothetical protein